MSTTLFVVSIAAIVANTAIAIADLKRAAFVVANSREVNMPESWLPVLATLKLAASAGLLLGMLGVPRVGVAAAIGLVLFYVGAITAHVIAGVFYNIAFPGAFLLLAVGSLIGVAAY
jgi:hypothetical protein